MELEKKVKSKINKITKDEIFQSAKEEKLLSKI
jgi:hypothetical protein